MGEAMIRENLLMDVNTELIRRAQAGDEDVIAGLYDRYHRGIYRYLYYRVGDQQAAEDLTSEVFLRMLRFISGFHPPATLFQAWLFQIARNLAIDHHRKMGVRNHLSLNESLASGNSSLVGSIDHSLTSDTLRQALERLTTDQRDVILMRFVAGMPLAQVAKALHKSEDAIKGLQRRGLITLRAVLADWEVDYDERG
jgi:RNA polymerase sigma-70 factor (ECF subfamily)